MKTKKKGINIMYIVIGGLVLSAFVIVAIILMVKIVKENKSNGDKIIDYK